MGRRLGREKALQALFAVEVGKADKDRILSDLLEDEEIDSSLKDFTKKIVDGVLENLPVIDNYIEKYSKEWSIARIGKVELCALRIAIYEMLFLEEIPPLVSIDEALELIKLFSVEESVKFSNGILNKVYKSL